MVAPHIALAIQSAAAAPAAGESRAVPERAATAPLRLVAR
jgi:hypothetical protein